MKGPKFKKGFSATSVIEKMLRHGAEMKDVIIRAAKYLSKGAVISGRVLWDLLERAAGLADLPQGPLKLVRETFLNSSPRDYRRLARAVDLGLIASPVLAT